MGKSRVNTTGYCNPLTDRYAGRSMSYVWSPQYKHSTWRRLWLTLARCEKELGLNITDGQIAELESHLEDIDFDRVAEIEKGLQIETSHSIGSRPMRFAYLRW